MNLNDHIDMKGRLRIKMLDPSDRLIFETAADNDIVLSGRDLVARMFINETIAPISHLAIGDGTDPVDPRNDLSLGNETFRKAIVPIDPAIHLTDTEEGKKKIFVSAELELEEGIGTITEAGLFNSAEPNSGVMYNRVVFAPITKEPNYKLVLIWEIVF